MINGEITSKDYVTITNTVGNITLATIDPDEVKVMAENEKVRIYTITINNYHKEHCIIKYIPNNIIPNNASIKSGISRYIIKNKSNKSCILLYEKKH